MITCKLRRCGLGSQLFQIATTLALAWDNNDQAVFDFFDQDSPSQGKRAWDYSDTIYRRLTKRTSIKINKVYKEPHHHYSPIPYKPNMCLDGFFMSGKYFDHHRERLIDTFRIPCYPLIDNVSIHVRRGDYLKMSGYHPPLSIDYYFRAIELFPSDTQFLIFSDDIEWCKENFRGDNYTFRADSSDDVRDLVLMSLCSSNIIANSTFSWWASWFNRNPNKTVIAPEQWFGKQAKSTIAEDIYRKEMIRI